MTGSESCSYKVFVLCKMDAYGFVTVLLLVLSSTRSSSQVVQEALPVAENTDKSLSSTAASTQSGNSEVAKKNETECFTPKNLVGACVTRQMCDYSTPAVDLTLYAHRGYSNPCTLGEVCCPVGALRKVDETTAPPNQDFEFDDDD